MRDSRRKRAAKAVGRVERRELLQRDLALEVGLAGELDDGHSTATDLPEELEAADSADDVGHF